ncbi:MAG: lipopolysaccharide biosynthesis protein [Acidobacteria bacterium]|nr:lipopolysaccharide biosynthesis protein [Acidobacteriota bacterium]
MTGPAHPGDVELADAAHEGYLDTSHLRADLGARSARSGAITVTTQLAKFCLMLITTVILARLLRPADYGLIGMVTVLTGFIALFKDIGLSSATVQRPTITHSQVSTLFWLNVLLGGATMLVAMAMAPVIAHFYREPRVTAITIGLACTFLINGFAVQHQALLQRRMQFGALAAIDIVATCGSAAVAITLARRGHGYWSLVMAQVATAMIALAGVWLASRWRPSVRLDLAKVTSLVAFGRNLTGFHIVNYFARHLDNALIGRFWGPFQLGIYDKAYQILLLPIGQINAPITAVAMPALSRLVSEPDAYRRAYCRILEKVILLTMPGVALMVLTADWLVMIVLGPTWAQVTPVFVLLGLSAPVAAICDTTGWLFVSQGRTRDMLTWGLIGSGLIVTGIAAGVPWGGVGVAATYSATMVLLVAPLLFWFVTRKGPIRQADFYVTVAPIAGATCVTVVALLGLRSWLGDVTPWSGLTLAVPCALSVFIGALLMSTRGRTILQDAVAMRRLLQAGRR